MAKKRSAEAEAEGQRPIQEHAKQGASEDEQHCADSGKLVVSRLYGQAFATLRPHDEMERLEQEACKIEEAREADEAQKTDEVRKALEEPKARGARQASRKRCNECDEFFWCSEETQLPECLQCKETKEAEEARRRKADEEEVGADNKLIVSPGQASAASPEAAGPPGTDMPLDAPDPNIPAISPSTKTQELHEQCQKKEQEMFKKLEDERAEKQRLQHANSELILKLEESEALAEGNRKVASMTSELKQKLEAAAQTILELQADAGRTALILQNKSGTDATKDETIRVLEQQVVARDEEIRVFSGIDATKDETIRVLEQQVVARDEEIRVLKEGRNPKQSENLTVPAQNPTGERSRRATMGATMRNGFSAVPSPLVIRRRSSEDRPTQSTGPLVPEPKAAPQSSVLDSFKPVQKTAAGGQAGANPMANAKTITTPVLRAPTHSNSEAPSPPINGKQIAGVSARQLTARSSLAV